VGHHVDVNVAKKALTAIGGECLDRFWHCVAVAQQGLVTVLRLEDNVARDVDD
jgi:hypothetical protein